MSPRAQFQEALDMLRVDVDALGIMAEHAVVGALSAADLKHRDDVLDETFRRLVAHLLSQEGPGAPSLVLHAHGAGRPSPSRRPPGRWSRSAISASTPRATRSSFGTSR